VWVKKAIMLLDPARPASVRLQSILGFAITSLLVCLGAIWPSLFTIVALAALPSPLMFAVSTCYPKLLERRPGLRLYLLSCVLASLLCWIDEVSWLTLHASLTDEISRRLLH
jgi:hypothetical protein